MRTITKSVIKLSEIPEEFHKEDVLVGHKEHTYIECHIDDSLGASPLTLWMISQYPTIKRKISFLIHIDI